MSVNILVEARVQPKAILDKENPILASGEIALDKELSVAKMGDGINPWEDLSELTVDKETLEKWYNVITGVTNSRLITLPNLNFAYTTVNVDSNPLIEDIVDTIVVNKNYFSLLEEKKIDEEIYTNNHNTLTFGGSDIFDIMFLTSDAEKRIDYVNRLGFKGKSQNEIRYYLLQDIGARDQINNLNDNLGDVSTKVENIWTTLYDEEEGLSSKINSLKAYDGTEGKMGLVPPPLSAEFIDNEDYFLHISGQWKTIKLSAEEILVKEFDTSSEGESQIINTVSQALNFLKNRNMNINFYDVNGYAEAQKPQQIYITGIIQSDATEMYYHPNIYIDGKNGVLMGAAYNDYAEARQTKNVQAGRVVIENGDDTLSISTDRLQLGGNIVSDTYGMLIGETDEAKTPIALCGRVLAYPNEDRSEYYAGAPVCTGPNGTVSIMSKDEVLHYPECIIGYVSAVPTYEEWNGKKVNGRIWIKVI